MSFDSDDNQQVSTTNSAPPAWVQPYSEELVQRSAALSQDPWEYIPGAERVAPLSAQESLGIEMGTNRAVGGSPLNAQAGATLSDIMGGNGAAFSDLTDRRVGSAQAGIVDQFNLNVAPSTAAAFNQSNTLGSTGHQELEAANRYSLARALGETEDSIRSNALGQGMQAAQLAPKIAAQDYVDMNALMQFGGASRGIQQAMNDAEFARFLDIRDDPQRRLNVLGAGINTGSGGYATNTVTSPGQNQTVAAMGGIAGLLGGAGTLLGELN